MTPTTVSATIGMPSSRNEARDLTLPPSPALTGITLNSVDQIDIPHQRADANADYRPPDGGYGWVCVVAIFLINTHTWGLNFVYGVFLDYFVAQKLYRNATDLDYALIGGLSISMSLIITPAINASTRKLGTRPTLTIGLVLLTASFIGASFSTEIWHLYLSQGICFGWGLGFLYVGSSNIIPQWFSSRRSLANGIAASGAGFGGLVYSLASSALLQKKGPETTFRVLALCEFVANLVSILLIKDRNEKQKPNHASFQARLLKRPEIWLMIGWGGLSELGYTTLLFTLPNYARSIGLSPKQGSIVLALLNLTIFLGRPLIGRVSDTFGRINIATITTGFCGLICLVIWVFAKSFGVLCFFTLLAGLFCGTFWATVAPVTAEITGLSEVPSTLAILLFGMVVPTTFATAIALKLRRSTGDIYLDAQVFVGFMYIGASICTCCLRVWKIYDLKQHIPHQLGTGEQQTRSLSHHRGMTSTKVRLAVRGILELEKV